MSSQSLGPTVAASRSASTIDGSEMKTSIVRMRKSSSLPREYAASRPTVMPSDIPIAVETPESTSTERPPYRKRLSTSRPSVSVPSHASLDGGANGSSPSTPWSGSYGATSLPKTAMPTSSSVIPRPIFVRCCFQAAEKRTRSGPRRGPSSSTSSASASLTAMSVIGKSLADDGGGAWGTGRFPTFSGRRGLAGETWFPPRTRAEGRALSLHGRPEARADEDGRDVGQEVQHDVQRGNEERDRLHRRHVAGADRLDEQ